MKAHTPVRLIAVFLLALAISAGPAQSDEFDDLLAGGGGDEAASAESNLTFDFGGEVQARLFVDVHQDNNEEALLANRDVVFAQGIFGLNPKISFLMSGLVEYRLDTNYRETETAYVPELWELYATFRLGPVDLLVGQQIVTWGKLDAINPVNNVNPFSFSRFFLYLGEDYSDIPLPMARATWYFAEGYFLEGVWIPFFRPMELDVSGGDWSLAGPLFPMTLLRVYLDALLPFDDWEETLTLFFPEWEKRAGENLGDLLERAYRRGEEPRADDLTNSEFGLRIGGSAWYFDFAASYLCGWDDMPTFHVSSDVRALARILSDEDGDLSELGELDVDGLLEPFAVRYHRLHTIGLEAAFTYGDWALKGEAAYQFNKRTYTRDLTVVSRDQINWSASVEYTFPSDLIVLAQWWQIAHPGHTNGLLTNKYNNLAAFALRKTFWRERLECLVALVYDMIFLTDDEIERLDLFGEDWFLIPVAKFEITDELDLQLGGQFFGGRDFTWFGYLKKNSQFMMTVKYSF